MGIDGVGDIYVREAAIKRRMYLNGPSQHKKARTTATRAAWRTTATRAARERGGGKRQWKVVGSGGTRGGRGSGDGSQKGSTAETRREAGSGSEL